MTVTTGGPDVAVVVRALSDANVQFVVVGEPAAGHPLRLVVSRHPTNLDALGRALDRLESTVRAPGVAAPEVDADPEDAGDDPPRRVGDPMGTISVATAGGDVDLMFGGPRRSLYADVAVHAEERELGGLRVQWTGELPAQPPVPRTTSRMLGRRLLSLAEGLAQLIDRHGEDRSDDGDFENDD
jgi:hypothetical protein